MKEARAGPNHPIIALVLGFLRRAAPFGSSQAEESKIGSILRWLASQR